MIASKSSDTVELVCTVNHPQLTGSLLLLLRQPPLPTPIANDRQSPPSSQIPENLHEKRFTLSPDAGDTGTYEIIDYRRERDNSVTYELLSEDSEDPIEITAEEMMGMEDSLYTPV